jgi:hypothetical protein
VELLLTPPERWSPWALVGDHRARLPQARPLLWGFGDLRRGIYEACGGFPIMEDFVFIWGMEGAGPTAYLLGPVISATRRWEGRPLLDPPALEFHANGLRLRRQPLAARTLLQGS